MLHVHVHVHVNMFTQSDQVIIDKFKMHALIRQKSLGIDEVI